MILIALGTQDIQFNRLLKEIDRLIEDNTIKEEVYAQTGFSDYEPEHFRYVRFTGFEDFNSLLKECSFLITHGGTGTIVSALKMNKKVIAVPRLKEYGEHVDNHQLELIRMYAEKNLIIGLDGVGGLRSAILRIADFRPAKYESGKQNIINIIEGYFQKNFK